MLLDADADARGGVWVLDDVAGTACGAAVLVTGVTGSAKGAHPAPARPIASEARRIFFMSANYWVILNEELIVAPLESFAATSDASLKFLSPLSTNSVAQYVSPVFDAVFK